MKNLNLILSLCMMLAIIWQPHYSQAQTTYAYGTAATENFRVSAYDATNNTYLMGGMQDAAIDNGSLTQLDPAGNILWGKNFTHSKSMDIRDIHVKANGNAIVVALVANTTADKYETLVMELDANGTILWSKTYVNTNLSLLLLKIVPLSSGDYVLVGKSTVDGLGASTHFFLTMVKIDAAGTVLWERREFNPQDDNMAISDAIELSSGSLLLSGFAWHEIGNSGGLHNGYLSKVDLSDGSTTWHKIYPSSLDVQFHQPHELPNGDIAIAGFVGTTGFTTYRQLFMTVDSTSGAVQIARDYNFPGGQRSISFKVDPTTGNFFCAGEKGATASASDRDIYWMELTDDGSFVDGYEYTLPDYDGGAMLELDANSIRLFSTTKSFAADPSASPNNDFTMFLLDRNDILADCNISQFTASPAAFTFGTLVSTTLTEDTGFSVTEAAVTLTVADHAFLEADVCQEEDPLLIEGVATNGDCDATGSIDITVSGGEAPYSYLWSTGEITEDIAGLSTGTYTVTTTDNAGNSTTASFNVTSEDITEPVTLCQDITIPLDATGNASIDASMIDAGSSDNCGILQMDLDITSFDCSNLGPNTVTLSITDLSGNISTCAATVTVVNDNEMTVSAVVSPILCDGTAGMIDLTVTGGIPNYTFLWSNSTEDEDLTGITEAGTYSVIITDDCGGQIEQVFTVGAEDCPCEMNVGIISLGCSAAGTCDPSDDSYTFIIGAESISGAGSSNRYYVYDATSTPHTLIGDYNYGDTDIITLNGQTSISLLFVDFDNPECDTLFTAEWEPCAPECPLELECPEDINVTLDGTGCDVIVDYDLYATDCLEATLTLLSGLPSGSAFPLGTTTVSYELHYNCTGVTLNCSFNVNVSNVAPTAADYVLSGSAAAIAGEGECYQLTTTSPDYQRGSIYYQAKLNLDYDFQLDFEINLGSIDGDGADGMMFILQPISSSLGTSGGSLGFGGIGSSVGIEFDTWQNSFATDPQNDHISFQRNGNLRHNAAGYLDATVTRETVPNMEVGAYRPVTVKWNATTKELTYIYNNRPPRTVTQDIANTIFGGNPNVFWGWSGSTGASVNNQSVCINNVSFVEGMTIDATITDIPCNGLGEIDLTVSGGIPGYTFLWSDGTSDEDLSSITTGGDYSVTITDACGHTVIQTYTVGEEVDCDCEITSTTLTQEGCENMSTSDTSDDIITLFVNATADNGSGSFNVVDASTFAILGTFPYGTGGMITVPYSASISLIYEDAANPECSEANAIDLQGCEYCTDLNINIVVDNYPKETSWELIDANGNVIQDSNGHLGQNPDGTVFDYNFCLPDGCYEFIIYDSYGDGICCDPFYGNGSYTVTDVTSNTVLGQGGQFGSSETTSFCFGDAQPVSCTYEAIKFSNFENGWGFWVDGGEDAERMVSPGTVGTYSIRLRDNTSESVMTSKQLDLTNYTEATIDFAYRPISMDNATEDFFLEISLDGGVTFSIVEEWNQGDEFINGRNYVDAVVIPGPFSSDTRFRFRCDAGGDGDYVFIDRVTISGCEIDAVASKTAPSSIHTTTLGIGKLYPNPAHDYVNIEMKSKVEGSVSIHIYRTTGQLAYSTQEHAYEGKNEFTVNLDKLTNGTYMVEINDGNKTDIQRLVIMK